MHIFSRRPQRIGALNARAPRRTHCLELVIAVAITHERVFKARYTRAQAVDLFHNIAACETWQDQIAYTLFC